MRVQDCRLCYYRDSTSVGQSASRGSCSVYGGQCQSVSDRKHVWRFDVACGEAEEFRLFRLRGERASDVNRWLDALRRAGAVDAAVLSHTHSHYYTI